MAIELGHALVNEGNPGGWIGMSGGLKEKAVLVLIGGAVAFGAVDKLELAEALGSEGRRKGHGCVFLLEDFVDGNEAVGRLNSVNVGVLRVRSEFATAACHLEDELAGGNVPEGDAGLDVGIESAAGGVGHGEGGAAHHAHLAAAEGRFAKAFESNFECLLVFATTDEDDGLFEFGALADAQRAAIEEDFAILFRGPGFVGHGVVDHAHEDVFSLSQGDGDAEVWDAVEEIDGAIDGIDDPLELGVLIAAEAFFAIEGMVGILGSDAGEDEILGLAVELKLEVVVQGFVDRFVLVKVVAKELAHFMGGAEGDFEIGHAEDLAGPIHFEKEGWGKIFKAGKIALEWRGVLGQPAPVIVVKTAFGFLVLALLFLFPICKGESSRSFDGAEVDGFGGGLPINGEGEGLDRDFAAATKLIVEGFAGSGGDRNGLLHRDSGTRDAHGTLCDQGDDRGQAF